MRRIFTLLAMMMVVGGALAQAPPSTKAPILHKPDSVSILSAANASLYCKAAPDSTAPIYRSGSWNVLNCSSFNSLLGGLMDDEVDLLLSVLDLRIDLQSSKKPGNPTSYSQGAHLIPAAYQAPVVPPASTAPQLSITEKVALQSISDKMKSVQEQMKAVREALVEVETEIAKNHPGYHLSETTGGLESNLPAKPTITPVPAKK